MTEIAFRIVGTDHVLDFVAQRVLIAGYTGRDAAAVEEHIAELAREGIARPDSFPIVIEVPAALLAATDNVEVSGENTSGEVEPVVLFHGGRRWLTVGSDHTDRDVERRSIPESKRSCPKVIATSLLRLGADDDPDSIELASWLDGDGAPYQEGTLAYLLPIPEIEKAVLATGYVLQDGDVLFLGTIPVLTDSLIVAAKFNGRLRRSADEQLEFSYTITVREDAA